jgi:hypothetical protein
MMLNKNLQEINIQNMDTELVAQMFKNYQSNVLFHLEGMPFLQGFKQSGKLTLLSYKWSEGSSIVPSGTCCIVVVEMGRMW